MNIQQKNIRKTIAIIVLVMVVILGLFLNKITTPRYLSNIELKINGLILIEHQHNILLPENNQGETVWRLVASGAAERTVLENLQKNMRGGLSDKIHIVDKSSVASLEIKNETIPIIKPSGEYFAYFKMPYDNNKMILTLSSVLTHR